MPVEEDAVERKLEEATESTERKPEVIEMAASAHKESAQPDELHRGPHPGLSREDLVAEVVCDETIDKVPVLKPIICTMIICIGSFVFGTAIAWPSPAIPDLNGHPNSFFVTDTQSSWIGSILTLGALLGALIGGPYMDHVGRKLGLISVQVVFVAGWIVITASTNFACLLVGRVITGIAMGVLSVICPVYIAEISPSRIRGLLGSCHQLFICIGIFVVYCFGAVLHWNWLAVFCAAFDLLLAVIVCFIPESPRWLLATGRKEAAEYALKWLRGENHDVKAEIAYLERSILESRERAAFGDFFKPNLLKPLLISLCLMLFQQFSGINVIMFYSVQIFKDAGSDMNPNTQSMLVGAVGIIGTLVSVFIVDLAGRRILLAASAALMALSIAGMGAFFYEKTNNPVEGDALASWLPVVCLIVFNFGFDCAFGPVPWLMMGELFPQKAKGIACSICTVANWLFAFILTKFFDDMTKSAMNTWGAYWFCCAFCVIAIPFSLFVVPETKGKTLEQIQAGFK